MARILVVEDEGIVARDIKDVLERLGHVVTHTVASGTEAIERAGETPTDLVLMDIVLRGGMDGVEAAERIRERFHLPVVYLTAYADEATLQRAKLTTPFGYILKPFEERDLRTTVEIALYKHSMERKLRESEQWLATTLRSIGDGVTATDEKGAIVFMNRAVETITGWRPADALGRDAAEVLHILDLPGGTTDHPVRTVLREGATIGFDARLKLVGRDGSLIDVNASAAPIKDEAGNVRGSVLVFRDVTEQRRWEHAQEELRAALAKAAAEWELTFDSMEAPILILDEEGRIARLNRAAKDVAAEAKFSAVLGRALSELGPAEPWRKAEQVAAEVRSRRSVVHAQVRDSSNGRTWELSAGPAAASAAKDERVLVVAHDVTRMVELQDSLRRSETMSALGLLLAGVAHEVRNPLFSISANLDAFEAEFGTRSELEGLVTLMRTEVERLAALMRELLEYGRPAESQRAPGTIDGVVADAVEWSSGLARRHGVTIANDVGGGFPQLLMDKKRLVQVLENLLQNAIQHSPQEGVVRVDAGIEEDAKSAWVAVAVSDDGTGFAPGDLPQIFEPFFSRRRGGTGLGLAIAQRIVEEHGGTISAANRTPGGARVVVKLPCVREIDVATPH